VLGFVQVKLEMVAMRSEGHSLADNCIFSNWKAGGGAGLEMKPSQLSH
jgi:hypothetical protein